MKLDDQQEEFEDRDREEDEDREEAETTVKPMTKALVFAGLVAAAAVISAVLWNVTHRGSPGEGSRGEQTGENVQAEGSLFGESSGPLSEEGSESDPGTVSESDPKSDPEEGPEFGSESDSEESFDLGEGVAPGTAVASGEAPEASDPNAADNNGAEQDAGTAVMAFAECQDTVMPKELINLRSAPTTGQADNIVAQAANGEALTRTGINSDTGWSRLEYNGQTLYAVSRYLTTDLTYQPPADEPNPNVVNTKDGRTITFTDCDDTVSPKIYVNLRLEPSTSEGSDTVHCRLEYGEEAHRTGISEESGWSRVEYDGHVLYVVTSYIYVVEKQ